MGFDYIHSPLFFLFLAKPLKLGKLTKGQIIPKE